MKNISKKNIDSKICTGIISFLMIPTLNFASSPSLKPNQFQRIIILPKSPKKENLNIQNSTSNQSFSSNLNFILNSTVSPSMRHSDENKIEKHRWTLEDYDYLLGFIHENIDNNKKIIFKKNWQKYWKAKIPQESARSKYWYIKRTLDKNAELKLYFNKYYEFSAKNPENLEEFPEEHREKIKELIQKIKKLRKRYIPKKISDSELEKLNSEFGLNIVRNTRTKAGAKRGIKIEAE